MTGLLMLKKEKNIVVISSAILLGLVLYFNKSGSYVHQMYLLSLPLYFIAVYYINKFWEGNERIKLAVETCIDESEFNIMSNIEHLHSYFYNTNDVINFLSMVDPRVLIFVFDPKNLKLKNNEYLKGALECLSFFKDYNGHFSFSVKCCELEDSVKISTMLKTLYYVSKEMSLGNPNIHISCKKMDGLFDLNVSNNRGENDAADLSLNSDNVLMKSVI